MLKYFCPRILLLTFVFIGFQSIQAQMLTIGNGTFTGSNFAGPANTSVAAGAASRYAYIFPSIVLGTLRHGDTIRSLSFLKNAGGPIQGICNLKIYLRTTVKTTYGVGSVNWVNLSNATGMSKYYDDNPAAEFDSVLGWRRLHLNPYYIYDTTLGKNIEMLVQYTQNSTQSANTFWTFESAATVFGYALNQTKFTSTNGGTLTDTTNFSSEIHPTIRFEFPRNDYDLSVSKVYSMGKLPIPLGNPDTIKAIIQNVGKRDSTFKLYVRTRGANQLIDSVEYRVGSLDEKLVALPLLYPTNVGFDTVEVIAATDNSALNNRAFTYRRTTEYVYSYKDPTQPIAGGIGFNGSTGDFVARFYSSSPKAINQISVSFSGANQRFKLGIWEAGPNGKPGDLIWLSDTLNPAPTFIATVDPPVQVNADFFVGVRQLGILNVGFGYQPDIPVRANTFFYAEPQGDTNWVDFAPDAPFKFVIEPRIQAPNDVAPIRLVSPLDTVWLASAQTMAPKASIINYGTNDQDVPFNISMRIDRFGSQALYSVRQDSLKSGETKVITFDSTFLPIAAGDYDVQIITFLPGDQLKDNDTLNTKIVVAAFKDVGPGIIFDPSSGFDYEQFVDTIYPTVYIQNYGLDNQGPFNVVVEIRDTSGNLIYQEVKPYSLTALNSVIADFTPFPCSQKGMYVFTCYTNLSDDLDRRNDTVRRTFRIVRSNDVGISAITNPLNGAIFNPPAAPFQPEATINNYGDLNQGDQFLNFCQIYFNDSLVYKDSVYRNSFIGSPEFLQFKNFQAPWNGYYKVKIFTSLETDVYPANDTMISTFAVGIPDDIEILEIEPAPGSTLELSRQYATRVTLRNNGYNPQTGVPLIFTVRDGQQIQYLKLLPISIDSNETKTFYLDSLLSLNKLIQYQVQVFTALSEDFNKSNDTLRTVYNTKKTSDIGVSEILYPTLSDTLLSNTQNVQPIVEVLNYGDSLFKERFNVHFQVRNKSAGVLIYNKTIDTLFTDSGRLFVQFSGFNLGNQTDIDLKSFTDSELDQLHSNDTAKGESLFRIMIDPRADLVLLPKAEETYLRDQGGIKPKIRLANMGLGSVPDFRAILNLYKIDAGTQQETQVYLDTVWISGLGKNGVQEVDMKLDFTLAEADTGKYRAELKVLSIEDQNIANNTLNSNFYIVRGVGVLKLLKSDFKIYPIPARNILHIETSNMLNTRVKIVDVNGKMMGEYLMDSGKLVLNLSAYPEGVYFAQINGETLKFVVISE